MPEDVDSSSSEDPTMRNLTATQIADKHLEASRIALQKVLEADNHQAPEVKLEKIDRAMQFTDERRLARGGKLTVNDMLLPEVVQKSQVYQSLLRDMANSGKDIGDKFVKREAQDAFYHRQADSIITAGKGRINPAIVNSPEYADARREAEGLKQSRQDREGKEISPEELDRWALAIYLEKEAKKRKKGKQLMTLAQTVVGFLIGGTQKAANASKPDFEPQRAR
jgi:hypothetical protein